jgi:hypothetical protein
MTPMAAMAAATHVRARPIPGIDVRFGMCCEEGGKLAEEGIVPQSWSAGETFRHTILPVFASKVQTNRAGMEQPEC